MAGRSSYPGRRGAGCPLPAAAFQGDRRGRRSAGESTGRDRPCSERPGTGTCRKEKYKLLVQAVEKDGELSAKETMWRGATRSSNRARATCSRVWKDWTKKQNVALWSRMRSLEARERRLHGENARLLGELTAQWALVVCAFEDLERQLGGKPAEVTVGSPGQGRGDRPL